jgi:hypothetical protein
LSAVGSVVDSINEFANSDNLNLTYNRLIAIIYVLSLILGAVLSFTQTWWKIESRIDITDNTTAIMSTVDLSFSFKINGISFSESAPQNTSRIIGNGTVPTSSSGSVSWEDADVPELKSYFDQLWYITIAQMVAGGVLFIFLCFTVSKYVVLVRSTLSKFVMLLMPAGVLGLSITSIAYLSYIATASNAYICSTFLVDFGITGNLTDFCTNARVWSGNTITETSGTETLEFVMASNPAIGWWVQTVLVLLAFALLLMIGFGSDDLLGMENQFPLTAIDDDRSREIERQVKRFLRDEKRRQEEGILGDGVRVRRNSRRFSNFVEEEKSYEG